MGYSQLPSDWTSEVVHSFETKRFSCKDKDDDDDKSCHHDVILPKTEVKRWDKNESSRHWIISSCMYKKGWYEKTRYWF
ncbi:hypothetical protein [Photorhabdus luminescens]|uniref:hypothetical protein n=1 Tax=Photorhabdus luminescens TaxID=29488 RepID=UPI00210CCA82|nr:hypothetical protein [Photorhabdus luminescens]